MGKLFDILGQAVGVEPLDAVNDLPVKHAALVGEKTERVNDFETVRFCI